MLILSSAILYIASISPCFVLLAADDKSRPPIEGWGEVIDPDGDCQVNLDKGTLTIAVPATKHDLSVEAADMKAPRVLRDVEGDFIAQVKVSGNVRHTGARLSDDYLAYHGAGLLLWVDGQTYVRLERAAVVQENGEVIHYANFELRREGKVASSHSMEIPDQETYLRLERQGERVVGSVSEDGIQWTAFEPLAIGLAKSVKLGVAAINTSTDPFKAEFSEAGLYRKEAVSAPR
jgi:regulation of enolase protein 1 (concanavalin A-like superfamily)